MQELQRFWNNLAKDEKEIAAYFAFARPPVSVDTLTSFSGSSAVGVLRLMESLRTKGLVCEKKGVEKGFYFPKDTRFTDFVRGLQNEHLRDIGKKIIDHHLQSHPDGGEETVFLADLYLSLGILGEGLDVVKKAADTLRRSSQKQKAGSLYDHVIASLWEGPFDADKAQLFVDTVIDKTDLMMHRIPIQEQVKLLTRAEKIARERGIADRLVRIELLLAKAFQDCGRSKEATKHINEFTALSREIVDETLLKEAAQWMAEYYIWGGRFSEAIRFYETMVSSLEEFGDTENLLRSACLIGLAYAVTGRISRGIGMIEAVRSKAELLDLPEVSIYCDHTMADVLLELRRATEAEFYVNKLSALSGEALGPFLSWMLCDQRAYILSRKQDYPGALGELKKKAILSNSLGRKHSPCSWTFETLSILESGGLAGQGVDVDSFLESMLDWDDLKTRGVVLRYRALRNVQKKSSTETVLSDLEESERFLTRSGALFELARTRIALGKYYLGIGETKLGRQYLSKARESLAIVDSDFVPDDIQDAMPEGHKVKLMVQRMTRINESLGTIRNTFSFLDRVINVAMDLTGAMRGAFVTADHDELRIVASRNLDPAVLDGEKFESTRELMIESMKGAKGIISPSSDFVGNRHQEPTGNKDSAICLPARLGDEVTGFLYLDGRFDNDRFPQNLTPFVEMLCSQIAVGLNNIKTYEELKERLNRIEEEAVFYKKEMGMTAPLSSIIGESAALRSVTDLIRQVGSTGSSVLILGETGVGKEIVAKAIHSLSGRKDGPFIPVNLATLPPDLVASELFGHEKGAFTGALDRKKGRFELADGGTIFLDEIGDLSMEIQVKLLRVLQEGTFERLGGSTPVHSDFRVIAATNKNLAVEVDRGYFRQDLYFRLNVFPIYVPPLRSRKDDIPPLVHHFIAKYAKVQSRRIGPPTQQEMMRLLEYDWPGNVRELEHFVERAVILSDGPTLRLPELKPSWAGIPGRKTSTQEGKVHSLSLADVEREHIQRILEATDWTIAGPKGAARLLGLPASTLRFRIGKLGITRRANKDA